MLIQTPMTTLELMASHPTEWEALPQVYRDDDCLEFYEFYGILFCRPTSEEITILGGWECFYSTSDKVWKDTKTGRPISDDD